MPRQPKTAKFPRPIEVLVHANKRRNIPTAEFQSIAQQMEEGAPIKPAHYARATPLPRGEVRARAMRTSIRRSSGAACASG